ncbi:MAG: 4-hydroxy-3-methylbut-2-enyl diphosphate reductase, partial [uncultured Frankineae bacterium]
DGDLCATVEAGAGGQAPRLLRRRRPGGPHGGEGAGGLRRPRLRPQADRPQRPRRADARAAGRDLRRRDRAGARGRHRGVLRPRRRTHRARRGPGPAAQDHRRDLSAGHQGAHGGQALRRGRPRHRAHRARGSRGGRRHDRAGAPAHPPRRRSRGGLAGGGARPGQGGLPVPDDAVGRRDERDRRRPAPALPPAAGSAVGRHLLRHAEPSGRRQGDRGRVRPRPGRRLAQQLELRAAGRGRPGRRRQSRSSGRRRVRDRRELARGCVHCRPDQRCVGARDAGAAGHAVAGGARLRRRRRGRVRPGAPAVRAAAGAASRPARPGHRREL